MDVTKYVADKIKYYRQLRNMTQQEVAELIGTTQQSIARYENADRETSHNILFQLADIYNVSVDDFFPSSEKAQIEHLKETSETIDVYRDPETGLTIELRPKDKPWSEYTKEEQENYIAQAIDKLYKYKLSIKDDTN